MTDKPPFVLVPGFWLGAWAWDRVAAGLRAQRFFVEAVTLPGLESVDTDRSRVTMDDHVDAVVRALEARGEPTVLAGHSGSGMVVYAAADRRPDLVRRLVYVDSGPFADGIAMAPDLPPDVVEVPLPPWEELAEQGSSIEGLSDEQLAEFRRRAVPQPACSLREPVHVHDERRLHIPATMIASEFSGPEVERMLSEGHPWFTELARADDVTIVDFPTGHWAMWSRADDLVDILARAAVA